MTTMDIIIVLIVLATIGGFIALLFRSKAVRKIFSNLGTNLKKVFATLARMQTWMRQTILVSVCLAATINLLKMGVVWWLALLIGVILYTSLFFLSRISATKKSKTASSESGETDPDIIVTAKRDKVIWKSLTYLAGITLCLVISASMAWLVASQLPSQWFFIPAFIIFGGLTVSEIFIKGLVSIPIGSRAVIFFFGEPTFGTWKLGTGWNWILKSLFSIQIFSIEIVPTNEQIQENPFTAEDEGFPVTALAASTDDGNSTGDVAELLVRATVRWKTFDSTKFIEFDEGNGGEKVKGAIRDLVIGIIRARVANMDNESFQKNLGGESKEVQREMDLVSKDNWGIDVVGVIITKAVLKDPVARQKQQARFIERAERAAEGLQFDFVIKKVEEMAQKLVGIGMSKENAAAEANRIVARERNKGQQIYVDLSGNNTGGSQDFTTAAAINAAAQQQREK